VLSLEDGNIFDSCHQRLPPPGGCNFNIHEINTISLLLLLLADAILKGIEKKHCRRIPPPGDTVTTFVKEML
jgi:hypothetical protein